MPAGHCARLRAILPISSHVPLSSCMHAMHNLNNMIMRICIHNLFCSSNHITMNIDIYETTVPILRTHVHKTVCMSTAKHLDRIAGSFALTR